MTGERLPQWQADRLAVLLDSLGGVSLGARERASLTWLAGFEADTVENIASVMRRLTRRAEVLDRRANRAIDDARGRHLKADRYWGQLVDLCEWAGLDPDDVDDPYEALLARLRDRGVASDDAPAAALLAETCPDCERVGPHIPVPGQPGEVECRVCSASWQQQSGGAS